QAPHRDNPGEPHPDPRPRLPPNVRAEGGRHREPAHRQPRGAGREAGDAEEGTGAAQGRTEDRERDSPEATKSCPANRRVAVSLQLSSGYLSPTRMDAMTSPSYQLSDAQWE